MLVTVSLIHLVFNSTGMPVTVPVIHRVTHGKYKTGMLEVSGIGIIKPGVEGTGGICYTLGLTVALSLNSCVEPNQSLIIHPTIPGESTVTTDISQEKSPVTRITETRHKALINHSVDSNCNTLV